MQSGKTSHQPFPRTRWTLVAQASEGETGLRKGALEELCRAYWPPVYAFIRSKGNSPAEAEDLTQGFFADFLERKNFSSAKGKRGKLRTFLLDAVTKFMAKDYRDRTREKRGGTDTVFSLDLTDENGNPVVLEPEDGVTPEKLFEKQWALTVLQQVFEKLHARYTRNDQTDLFESLKFVIQTDAEQESYASVATRLGMEENAIKIAAYRLRKRYGLALRESVADTLSDGENVKDELRELMNVFS